MAGRDLALSREHETEGSLEDPGSSSEAAMDAHSSEMETEEGEGDGGRRRNEDGVGGVLLGARWAHPISVPEQGCLLVASELLHGYDFFERSVILLLDAGNSETEFDDKTRLEGRGGGGGGGGVGLSMPYGIALNKPTPQPLSRLRGLTPGISRAFGDCLIHLGGPLDHLRFLAIHGRPGIPGCEEVLPGAFCCGASAMEAAASIVLDKEAESLDFRFYFGYAGWDREQLMNEINQGWWHVVAASSDVLLKRIDGLDLWEEVLQLMDGQMATGQL
eukprot:TRINITY_DN11_c0_g3_i1.p1 TRINITY_DN11_c0_g3~~TRINITY_DN11_c0_g3_i1.p1  ORF type:complete len:323 (+),score=87.96 TRINITY_DN11_c0_g3_i1:146-970(+)